ncbi:hypothetical protein JCM17960_12180 [Magnetospira thiophila]
MTPIDDATEELLSRGLDADLDRAEMRQLYRVAAQNPDVPREMGELAGLEAGMQAADAPLRAVRPSPALAANLERLLTRRPAPASLWHWLHIPRSFSFQPLSFAGGAALAALLVVLATPLVTQYAPGFQRLNINNMKFVDAQTDLDWTYQFLLHPGQSTRVTLDLGDTRPVQLQFEAPRPTPLTIVHQAPGLRPDTERRLTIDGIMYASLRDPRPGDVVELRNDGQVPVLVYAYTNGYGGSWVSAKDDRSL